MEESRALRRWGRGRLFIILLVLSLTLMANPSHLLPSAPLAHAQPAPLSSVEVLAPNGSNNVTDLSKSKSSVTFQVNVTNSPPLNSFGAVLDYNTTVLGSPSIDYTGNVLGPSANPQVYCIDGHPTAPGICLDTDGPGRVDFVMYLLGNQTTPTMIPKGLLFHVTFNILTTGLGQVHLFAAQLVGLSQNRPVDFPVGLAGDAYYTNMACPTGSGTPCRPPLVTVTYSPQRPSQLTLVTFNTTVIERNAGAVPVYYTWDFGDGDHVQIQTNLTQPMQHRFIINALQGIGVCVARGNCSVTILVADSANVFWKTTVLVSIVHISVILSVGDILIDHQFNVDPGTLVHITAHIINTSTIGERATMNLTLEGATPPLSAGNFTLAPSGGSGELNATWDTTNKIPRVYGIVATIGNVISVQKIITNAHPEGVFITFQNDTSGIQKTSYVLVVIPMVTGTFSLNLLQTTGLGIVIFVAAVAGLARFLKKPSYESEPL